MDHLVCAYRRSDSNQLREDFNFCVAKARVTNEHCIGVLKSRWHSLRELLMQLKSDRDNTWLVRWIILCAKLHNYVLSRNDLWTEEIDIETESDSETDGGEQPVRSTRRNARVPQPSVVLQARLTEYAVQFNRQPGGCLAP